MNSEEYGSNNTLTEWGSKSPYRGMLTERKGIYEFLFSEWRRDVACSISLWMASINASTKVFMKRPYPLWKSSLLISRTPLYCHKVFLHRNRDHYSQWDVLPIIECEPLKKYKTRLLIPTIWIPSQTSHHGKGVRSIVRRHAVIDPCPLF